MPVRNACFGITPHVKGHGVRHVALLPDTATKEEITAFAEAFRAFCAQHGLREMNTSTFITNPGEK